VAAAAAAATQAADKRDRMLVAAQCPEEQAGCQVAVRGVWTQCSDWTPIFIGMHRNAPLSPMEEGARVHNSYGSYAPSTYGSYEPRKANPITGLEVSALI
jgi:hypothetical protein